jgi:hypothetical protein
MPNYPLLATGQQAVTTGPAQPLPSVVPQNPLGAVLSGGAVRGEGVHVNLAAVGGALFYGNNNGVTTANGKLISAGASDAFDVNDLAQVFVVSAANGTSTASWSVTNK